LYLLFAAMFTAQLQVNANQGLLCNHFSANSAARGTEAIASPGHVDLMRKYDVGFYFLDLDIQRQNPYTISGNVLIRATAVVNSLDTFGIELANQFAIDS